MQWTELMKEFADAVGLALARRWIERCAREAAGARGSPEQDGGPATPEEAGRVAEGRKNEPVRRQTEEGG